MIIIEFSEQEAFALRNMIDLAVRHQDGGMRVAEAAVVLDRKILAAAQAAQQSQVAPRANGGVQVSDSPAQ